MVLPVVKNNFSRVYDRTWAAGTAEVAGDVVNPNIGASRMTIVAFADTASGGATVDIDYVGADGNVAGQLGTFAVGANAVASLSFDFAFPFQLRVTPAGQGQVWADMIVGGHGGGLV